MGKNEKVFILNKPFEGGYADKGDRIAHEIIDFFRADNDKIYVYNNSFGHCPTNIGTDGNNKYNLEYMFLTKKATIRKRNGETVSSFELTHLIKICRCLHHESAHREDDKLKASQDKIKQIIDNEEIDYAGKRLYRIYGNNDRSLYVTFEASEIYKAKKKIIVSTPGYRYQRNKGYVFSDANHEAFTELGKYTSLIYWTDITTKIKRVENKKYASPPLKRTFLDLILKRDSETCYTNMLYKILEWKKTMNRFVEKFGGQGQATETEFAVRRELPIAGRDNNKGGRTDLCAYNEDLRVVIENKIWSGLHGGDGTKKSTQLSVYYGWASQGGASRCLCIIVCPDFRKEEIEAEIETEMKGIYQFVTYKNIASFIKSLNKEKYFSGFQFESYVDDVIGAFKNFGQESKLDFFRQLFLETVQNA
ncbi:MAG: PD-(D/E)XK nuclease family protein [Bacilli bacterium]|nr:PD-(D/E)XK nuclease family protein [Bacilli bacterium]